MKRPLRRFAASPSLAFGGRGTLPEAQQSWFLGSACQDTSCLNG
jgi:hypothetical protein